MKDVSLVIIGFFLLIWGADRFVTFASALAKRLGVSSMLIGLTVVAFGTSLPEFSVSLMAALSPAEGGADISIGNVIGSNLFNLLAIVGLSAAIAPLAVSREAVVRDAPFSLGLAVALGLFAFIGSIGRGVGAFFLFIFALTLFFQIKKSSSSPSADGAPRATYPLWLTIGGILLGLGCIVSGGIFTVDGAVGLAERFGMSKRLIGITIVAVGTSLPELATSVVATLKKENDIAVGNVLGSNIFNISLILGLTAMIKPLDVDKAAVFDCAAVALGTVFFIVAGWRGKIGRVAGITMLLGYIAYIWKQASCG